MDLQLEGKRAIVTGGSRGIGKAIARQLALEGADVVIAARDAGALEVAAGELARETGRKIIPITADTGKEDSVNRLVASAIDRLGRVDILVNNAAVPGGISPATRLDQVVDEQVLEDINIKVVGYLRTARALAPHLVKNGWGRIINIGGLAIHRTGRPVATLRNVGVAAITKNLADELGPKGITSSPCTPAPPVPNAQTRRAKKRWRQAAASGASSTRARSPGWWLSSPPPAAWP